MTHVNPQWPEEGWDESDAYSLESDAYSLECGCDSDQQDHTCGPSRPPWIDPRACFGHCDPEGWHVPCSAPDVEVGGQ